MCHVKRAVDDWDSYEEGIMYLYKFEGERGHDDDDDVCKSIGEMTREGVTAGEGASAGMYTLLAALANRGRRSSTIGLAHAES